MTAAATLPMDVVLGLPEPARSRWQPLRAGILNLFLYDEQAFAFHRGRLLLRGNNGTGKSMALEVLLPYLLDAELTPSRLSTFGGRDRNMYLWLIGFDKTGTRSSERGYTWVEFGRRLPDGSSEYFTAGAMLEGTRDGPVKARYFTTAARISVHFSVGRPGAEPLNAQQLAAALSEQATAGRPGRLHPDGDAHRTAVNEALYRLNGPRYAALRRTLLQLRRPKLSDKLDERGLNDILKDSLPPVSDAVVDDLAEGFERLDRHSTAVEELERTMRDLRRIRDAYRGYARAASAARADAVAAAESAISTVGEKTTAALSARSTAESALASIKTRRGEINGHLARIRGQITALKRLDAYQKGQAVEPLRELVNSLRVSAAHTAETARRADQVAETDAGSAGRATDVAIAARENAAFERDQAAAHSARARTGALNAELAAALDTLAGTDVADDDSLRAILTAARELVGRLDGQAQEWAAEVESLRTLSSTAREGAAALNVARNEVGRAEADLRDAERALNEKLEEDSRITLAWISQLDRWAERSTQLRAGQAPPLPWDPATGLERAPRWATEAASARTAALIARQQDHLVAVAQREQVSSVTADAARRAGEVADLLVAAELAAAAYAESVTAYREAVTAWAATSGELTAGEDTLDLTSVPSEEIRDAASAWASRAEAARARTLLADQARVQADIDRISEIIAYLSIREQHLAGGGLPEPDVPPTRRANREHRAGAPLYMLVDFAASVSQADRLGIEAAALGSGVADAWLSPDGRLISRDSGELLLDTQLDAWASPSVGVTLADVLVADDNCTTTGVPPSIVTSVLTRIACSRSASAAATETQLVLGWDGSWRAGALTGGHQVDAVTFIGASNRETARLAALTDVRRQLEEQREELRSFETQSTAITSSLTRLASERASLPGDEDVRELRDQAQDAAGRTSRDAAELRGALARATLSPPSVADLDEDLSRGRAENLADSLGGLASEILVAPTALALAAPMRGLARQAEALAVTWAAAAASLRARAEDCQALCAAVEEERTAIPDAAAVQQARGAVTTAAEQVVLAEGRLATREEEERTARERSDASGAALRAALLANSLPDDGDTGALAEAVARYRSSADRWLRAGIDQLMTAGQAQFAHARSITSTETADRERAEAKRQEQLLIEREAELAELATDYGRDYQQIVAELEQLSAEQERLDQEKTELTDQERGQDRALANTEAELRTLEQQRADAENSRAAATTAFLAAHRLGLFAIAGLPDSLPGSAAEDEEPEPRAVTSIGVRAGRDWARAIREAVGERVSRDAAAVETAANRVTETRYQLEPDLAGKVSIRDERRDGLLILQASRGVRTLPLLDTISLIADEHVQAQQLLAQHEAELFRKFLADSTRREVTTKVRDARTAIKSMSALISGHPTGSGIQVRLNWVPDEKNAPGMQDIVTLMAKDAPLESERERLQDFFRSHLAAVRAAPDADYRAQMERLLDYRQWWRFTISFRRGPDQPYELLTSRAHGSLSGGEKAVCLHLPLFAAAASYCDSAGIQVVELDGQQRSGSPRLILLDEVFAGVDEDNRGDLFELIRTLDLDLVATSESEQGFYRQLDGLAVYHLAASPDAVLGTRTIWDGKYAHRILDLVSLLGADGEPVNGHST
jgi:hypothetical protein